MAESEQVLKRPAPHDGKTLVTLARKYGIFRIVKFTLATATGFLAHEIILVSGIFAVYHVIMVPNVVDYSFALTLLGLDVLALGTGDTVAFVINERVTVRVKDEAGREGRSNWFIRWGKYQLVAFMGNIMIAGVQLGLLATISLHPAFGDMVGAMVSYPVTYSISMHFVWGVRPFQG